MNRIEAIACAIGHHFWKCEDDAAAIRAGWDAAERVIKMLEEHGH